MPEQQDVIVIGAGIAGVSTALHLLTRGRKVLLVDRRGAGQETSYGNAGILQTYEAVPFGFPPLKNFFRILFNRDTSARLHYPSLPGAIPWIVDFYLQSLPGTRRENGRLLRPLNAAGLDEHRFLMRGTGAERHLSSAGRIALYRSAESFADAGWELNAAKEMGIPFDVLTVSDMTALEPHLKPAFHKAVRWTSSARLTNPGAVVTAYAERFVREGGRFVQAEVRGLAAAGDLWRAETSGGPVEAKEAVVCAGPWAPDILKPLGYRFPLGIKRGYHRHFSAIGSASLAHVFTDVDYGYVMAPMEQGYRLTTGAEFAGVNVSPNPVQLERILPRARELFALGDSVEAKAWCGSRPCFTDCRPVTGRAPRHSGLWLNIGHGHSGMTIGPPSGRLLAELMTGTKPFCDPAPYRAERFNC